MHVLRHRLADAAAPRRSRHARQQHLAVLLARHFGVGSRQGGGRREAGFHDVVDAHQADPRHDIQLQRPQLLQRDLAAHELGVLLPKRVGQDAAPAGGIALDGVVLQPVGQPVTSAQSVASDPQERGVVDDCS